MCTINIVSFIVICLNYNDKDKYNKIEAQFRWISAIILAILTIVPTVTGIAMMRRLRNRFDDIYNDHGCKI